MTTQEIYKLASELSEKDIANVLNAWTLNNDKKELELYYSLIKLGDSKELALSTTIASKYNSIEDYKMYYNQTI